jgi:hypothetical protein
MRLALVLAVLGQAQPAEAHCFAVWRYPWPQHCRVSHEIKPAPAKDKSYFVEVLAPETPYPALDPKDTDWRTPDQIKESDAHDAAVRRFKDDLNAQLKSRQDLMRPLDLK